MTARARTAMAVLVIVHGLVGCDNAARPFAPSNVPRPISSMTATVTLEPPSSPLTYTLTPSSNTVAPGGQLSISWIASRGGLGDWIGLFGVGAASCDHGWSEYTGGATSGTLTLTAPTLPGQYEFRYHPDGGCFDTTRSSPVTVSTGG